MVNIKDYIIEALLVFLLGSSILNLYQNCSYNAELQAFRNYFRNKIDSLEVDIRQHQQAVDSLTTKLDSLRKERPIHYPRHYETFTMQEFIDYLNTRYSK